MSTRTRANVKTVWALWAAIAAGASWAGGCADVDFQPNGGRESNLRAQLDQARTDLAAADRNATLKEAQLGRANMELQRLAEENRRLTSEREGLRDILAQERARGAKVDDQVKGASAQEAKSRETITRLEGTLRDREAALAESQAKYTALQADNDRLKLELAKLQQRLEAALFGTAPATRESPR
ncbi:MAG: hypothetical protein NTV86_08035 [Planctomycetota bacterium]|nr:hypothetical protein [Planctomycetota bacterium]